MANESRFKARETSLTFPADNVNTKQQIEITMVENCLEDNIIKISKKKVIWGKDEIPLTKWKSTQWSTVN